jgi:hypothetical protein
MPKKAVMGTKLTMEHVRMVMVDKMEEGIMMSAKGMNGDNE